MWNAEILETDFIGGNITITILYSKEDSSFRETYTLATVHDPDWIYTTVKGRIIQLEQLEAYRSKIVIGNVSLRQEDVDVAAAAAEEILNPTQPKVINPA